ncbi:MAG TPA: cysteine--tRNA ligase [Patescibacteria group bacterium]
MLKIFNSLSKQVEEFQPIHEGKVGMYACGPTVYDYAHIGHGRKYVNDDVLRRFLEVIEEYKVTHVQNVTDVGHLVSDADEGEDKMEKGARKAGKTVWEVAAEFTKYFTDMMAALNVLAPTVSCKATDHIQEQIDLIKRILENGYGYDTPEAVYFEVSKFADYGKLFSQSMDEKMVAARDEVSTGEFKKNPADFVLWFKRVGKYKDHIMHWDSPWGDGFPGWHIECSAMSMKYLGEQFDIHTGGEDHKSIHHPNEIAQSEAATGKKPFVKYWVHSAFLMVDGVKMSKSLGNLYKLEDIVAKGYSPMALRYLYLTTHYRKTMNFTWEGMTAAQTAYDKLNTQVANLKGVVETTGWSEEGEPYYEGFVKALEDDINTPKALAIVWDMMKSGITDSAKINLIEVFDSVLGLDLGVVKEKIIVALPPEIIDLMKIREGFRKDKNWAESDRIRNEMNKLGYLVKDVDGEQVVEKA